MYAQTLSAPMSVPVTNEQRIVFLQMKGVTADMTAPRMNEVITAWEEMSINE
jgi:hypothetical protein